MNDGLRKRISTAIVLGGGFLAIVFLLPPFATLVLLTALLLAGAWEWSAFLKLRSVVARADALKRVSRRRGCFNEGCVFASP